MTWSMLLQTERLILREFVAGDWPDLLAYKSDPRYLRFNPEREGSEARAREFVVMWLEQQAQLPRTQFQLAITQRLLPGTERSGRPIGNCGIRMKSPEASEADIGYELAPAYWGQGLATEAARAMVAFGFETLRLHRIWSHCIAENFASARVLEKLGMRLEGRLRENEWMKGRWWDTLLYAALEHEWRPNEATNRRSVDAGQAV